MDRDRLGDRATRTLRRITHRLSQHSRRLARNTGLTAPQQLCMRSIADMRDNGTTEVTVAAVADAVHLSRSTVSAILDRLVRAGLVERVRSERDRRRVDLYLTHAGAERLETAPRYLQARFVSRLAALPDHEQAELVHALERIVDLLESEEPQPDQDRVRSV